MQQLASYQQSTGSKLLDVLSVHYYPQDGSFSNNDSLAAQLIRNQTTRSLWDPNYVDRRDSIGAAHVHLIRECVAQPSNAGIQHHGHCQGHMRGALTYQRDRADPGRRSQRQYSRDARFHGAELRQGPIAQLLAGTRPSVGG